MRSPICFIVLLGLPAKAPNCIALAAGIIWRFAFLGRPIDAAVDGAHATRRAVSVSSSSVLRT